MIDQTISHYKILEKLGEGGMGIVYKAQDLKLDRLVALKFLPANLLASQEEISRFQQEAKALSALNHPHIATIYDIDFADGQRFIVLEYLSGGTLKSKIRDVESSGKELPIRQIVDYGIQIAEGLAYAHRHGIIHRDVKTDNMILADEKSVKITDFGLAKFRGSAQLTKIGSTVGTAAYMSPEQVRGEDIDHRSDIFSLGIVLYELMTGHLPFRGEHEASVSYSIVSEDPVPLQTFRPQLPPVLGKVIERCLEKEREKRYQDAEEIVRDLQKVQQELTGYVSTASKRSKVPWIAVTGATILVLGVLYILLPSKSGSVDRKSIAVLPFKNLSEEKENEYFSDGITEDIITQLSKISDLKVISRTSVMRYKAGDKALRDIGKELNVATILEGSVRRSGGQVRIVAQLIDAGTDEHLWAETYDKELTKIFAIQSDVAQQIAAALKAKLSPAEKERIEKKPTENLDAYTYYLKGRQYYYSYHKQDNENAIVLFKKALELDPTYALAYAGLGDAYGQRVGKFGFQTTWLDSSITASTRAIAIDSKLAEAYKALGLAYGFKGWKAKALEAYRKSVDLNPNYVPAIGNIGFTYLSFGKLDEALPWMKKSVAFDPSFAFQYFGTGLAYLYLDNPRGADEFFRKALELQPDFIFAHVGLCLLNLAQGEYQKAVQQSQTMLSIVPGEVGALTGAGMVHLFAGNLNEAEKYFEQAKHEFAGGDPGFYRNINTDLAYVYLKSGRRGQAQKTLHDNLILDQKLLDQGNELPGIPLDIAAIHAIQGNQTEAYRWLQKAIDFGWRDFRLALKDPLFENLRNEEQFNRMMMQVKAMVDEMRKRAEEKENK